MTDATDAELIARLRMVTGFIRFETGDRVAAAACLSEEAADRIEALAARVAVLEEALLWCGGSNDFHPGGIAHEGWRKVCAPLLWPSATP